MTTTPFAADPEDDPAEHPPAWGDVATSSGPTGASAPSRAHFQIYVGAGTSAAHWRLLSGNHRELGRSVAAARGAEDASLDIEHVRRRLLRAEPVVRPAAGHRWEWRLVDGEGTLAVSGHAFDRKLRCVRAAEQFVLLAPTSPVARNVITTGARRGAGASRGVLRRV